MSLKFDTATRKDWSILGVNYSNYWYIRINIKAHSGKPKKYYNNDFARFFSADNGRNMIKTVELLKHEDDENDFEYISLNKENIIDNFCDNENNEDQQLISILQNTVQNFYYEESLISLL